MSSVRSDKSAGVLRRGWSASVDDYAVGGGWTLRGTALVVSDTAGGLYAFDGKSGESAWALQGVHDGGVLAIAIHPNGTEFATAGEDGRVIIWDAAEGREKYTLDVGAGWVENVAWSQNGERLAASCARQVSTFSAGGTELWRSDNHPSTVSAIAWSSTGELATACYGRVTFFDASWGDVVQTLEWKGSLVSLALSPDGDVVACGSQDNSVHFWRRSTQRDSMMSGYAGKPSALAFDAAGRLLATGGGDAVTVWSFGGSGPEGTRPGVLALHDEPITALAFPRRGNRLASGGRDGSVAVWSLENDGEGSPIGVALASGVVADLFWRPDGRALAALDAEGGVTTWRT
ncbi:MAG: PQQ-binding-like beta-propeller repeat protein [Pseudomonadota bacterium]